MITDHVRTGSPVAARSLVFYDDARARTFEPFALSRPLCEMRAGALLIRERWEMGLYSAYDAAFVGARQLDHFSELEAAGAIGVTIPARSVLINSRAVIALVERVQAIAQAKATTDPAGSHAWFLDGKLAALQLRHDFDSVLLHDGALTLEQIAELDNVPRGGGNVSREHVSGDDRFTDGRVDINGVWLEEVWDIVRHLSPMLNADIPVLAGWLPLTPASHPGLVVIGEHPVYAESGCVIEPFTVFDTTQGPVLLREGSTVQSFTRVVGPCYVGKHSMLMGERVSGSSIGDTCRVHGELSATVFVGFSNKGHDGFVGHSIVGRWVNMGAGTITSNLKNTYGTVALWTPSGVRDTGLQFLGTLFGDHAKTGIGMKLTTGCVLGMGANVFDRMPPKVVEPFAWGSGVPYDTYDAAKFVETAARMMTRRHVELDEAGRRAITAAYAARWRTS
ncbi:MAG: hypothetical protein H7Z40_11790 [Phycisphaerae bacterium]|nr:hypothetical protein [Gemmatimonadaceae bacterium]